MLTSALQNSLSVTRAGGVSEGVYECDCGGGWQQHSSTTVSDQSRAWGGGVRERERENDNTPVLTVSYRSRVSVCKCAHDGVSVRNVDSVCGTRMIHK